MPELVLLVHGVNPDRTWPERVRRILEPHFRCGEITYHQYDGILGPVRAVIPVSALLTFIAAFMTAIALALQARWMLGAIVLSAAVISLAVGLIISRARRHHVLQRLYLDQYKLHRGSHGSPPHVIAHSLGSWLTAKAIELWPTIRFDRVIFAGSVAPRRFPWTEILQTTKPDAFKHLRNEVGRADWVVFLAGAVPFKVAEMGFGGRFGFAPGPFLHTQSAPRGPCDDCTNGESALIHNVPLKFQHSHAFLSELHAAELWLPELWGYQPYEIAKFFEYCQAMVTFFESVRVALGAKDVQDDVNLTLLGMCADERLLRSQAWPWTTLDERPAPLEQFFRYRLLTVAAQHGVAEPLTKEQDEILQDAINRAVFLLCYKVKDAIDDSDADAATSDRVLPLYPPIAMNAALVAALEKTPWKMAVKLGPPNA